MNVKYQEPTFSSRKSPATSLPFQLQVHFQLKEGGYPVRPVRSSPAAPKGPNLSAPYRGPVSEGVEEMVKVAAD